MYMLKCDMHILMRASWLVTDTAIVCVAMEKYPNAHWVCLRRQNMYESQLR